MNAELQKKFVMKINYKQDYGTIEHFPLPTEE